MPPKISTTREQILDAAFQLVRTEGLKALSARRLAQELGCSTQPIYRAYGSIDELKADVLLRAEEVARSYLGNDPGPGELPPFLRLGLGGLRFASEEPQLYAAVGQEGIILKDLQQGKPPPDFVLEHMRSDPVLGSLSDEQLTRVHALMWFFSQGLSTLFQSDAEGDVMATATEYLMLAGRAVIEFELGQVGQP